MSCRLYLISPPAIGDVARFCEALEAALGAGDVAAFQLRLKSPERVAAPDDEVLRTAETIQPILRAQGVHFLVNDRPDLARRCGADGVHIGQKDAAYTEARRLLGSEATIGVTCHASSDLAMQAADSGADYVAFGAFFPTRTKATTACADVSLIENWSYATTIPCVAIGGIKAENCAPIVKAGADFIAVSSAVWEAAGGVVESVRRLNAAIAAAA